MKQKIHEITKQIRALENGVTAADMERNGIRYDKNFGVSIVHLRQLAKRHAPDTELAKALWGKKWRETMILATLTADAKKVDTIDLEKWISECSTSELVEQISLNLTQHVPWVSEKISPWIESEHMTFLNVGATTLGHLAFRKEKLPTKKLKTYLPTLQKKAMLADACSRRAISLALRRTGRRDKELNTTVVEWVKQHSNSENVHTQWICQETILELTDEFVLASL